MNDLRHKVQEFILDRVDINDTISGVEISDKDTDELIAMFKQDAVEALEEYNNALVGLMKENNDSFELAKNANAAITGAIEVINQL